MLARNAKPAKALLEKVAAVALALSLNAAVTNARGAFEGDGLEPSDALADAVSDGVRDCVAEPTCVPVRVADCDGDADSLEVGC